MEGVKRTTSVVGSVWASERKKIVGFRALERASVSCVLFVVFRVSSFSFRMLVRHNKIACRGVPGHYPFFSMNAVGITSAKNRKKPGHAPLWL